MRWPFIKHLPDKTNFRFVAVAKPFAAVSILAVIASIFFTVWPLTPPCGGLNCGVDFKGGTVLEVSTGSRPPNFAQIRAALDAQNFRDVQVQESRKTVGEREVVTALVRFVAPEGVTAADATTRAKEVLPQVVPELTVLSSESVSGKVSNELFGKGLTAMLIAIGLMMVYIWFRFGLTFGIGAVVALFHDVILTFGLFAFTQIEFTLTAVAAVLTIIGYSMNDTVVVLDRIRENLRKYKKTPLRDLVDLSINETLSRTVITGVTGLMALVVLALFGGEALFAFAVAMIFGIVVGTYSSIFVAAPVLLLLGVKRGDEEPTLVGPAAQGRPVPKP